MLTGVDVKTRRPYVMRARAEAAEETRRRVRRAASDLFWEQLSPEMTLDSVAERAGVSVQTILRHFGSREGLMDAAEAFGRDETLAERAAPAGDVDGAIRAIFDHYERRGDAVMRMLGQEHWVERVKRVTDHGRRAHRRWVEEAFAPQLQARPELDRESLTDLLVVATDVYTWKLLRRDRGLERPRAEDRVRHMVGAVLAATRQHEQHQEER
jgi:AcrR family transcriptional regulator